jgi:ribosomal protein S12 methylthiotransferase
MLVQRGVKEISVISEDTTKYGKDLKAGYDLCTLLVELNKIPELRWIRLLYSYPGSVTDELIDVIGNSEKICNYIDIPIQHISDPVLSRMNRTYKRKHVENIIKKLRNNIPDIAIRTTVIAGFPGETKQEFIELSDFLTEMEFERLGVFEYSDEEGTEAYSFDGKIDSEEISERYEELRLNQDDILERSNSRLIGKTLDVIVDNKDETSGDFIGRTYMDAPEIDLTVRIQREVNTGEFTTVKIENTSTFEIIGK